MLFDMIKHSAKQIDVLLFDRWIQKVRREWRLSKNLYPLNAKLNHRSIAYYTKNQVSLLSELCEKYGSDKGAIRQTDHPYPWAPHTYADFYSRLFDHCRRNIQRVFECGLGTNKPNFSANMGARGIPGASLRVWREYFPNAAIVGADIDRTVLFQEERISTFYVDQTDQRSINDLWNDIGVGDFDVMVDEMGCIRLMLGSVCSKIPYINFQGMVFTL